MMMIVLNTLNQQFVGSGLTSFAKIRFGQLQMSQKLIDLNWLRYS